MRSGLVLALVLGACGFHRDALVDTPSPDSPVADASDNPPEDAGPSTAPAFCDPADTHQMVCYALDGNATDGSSHQLNATVSNVSFVEDPRRLHLRPRQLIVYVDGSPVQQAASNFNVSTASMTGMSIGANNPNGDHLIGLLDQLRLIDVARTAAEICADAGRTDCP